MLALLLVFASVPSLAAGSGGQPRPCRYEENCDCAAPGITLRWKAAYCMALAETDDLEHRGVQVCLGQPDPQRVKKLGSCEQNTYWKTRVCRVLHKTRPAVRECVQDRTFVPRFVEYGPGS
jgi:hypothetical protein